MARARPRPLTVEYLEDRTAPATFGLPWGDATHLTLSWAPDGTPIAGHQSDLFQALDRRFPTSEVWQGEIVRAFQTWAVQANLSVGLKEDSGSAVGIAGRMQGDARFGDIRVAAHRMSDDVLSISVPPDPFLSGTLAGDVFLNSAVKFKRSNLFPVLLHEAGHVFGLEHSSNPRSVMYSHFNSNTTLTAGDIASIQALYGNRTPDRNEPNDSFATATGINYSGFTPVYAGTTPLVAYGDRTTSSDVDYFSVQPLRLYSGPVTFRLQTEGVSFLAPRLSVYDENFNLLGQAQTAAVFGDVLSVRLSASNPLAQRYYVRIDSRAGDLFGIGRYALAVTFDNLVVDSSDLPDVLRGPYDALNEGDINQILANPTGVFFNNDLHTNDTILTAESLTSRPAYRSNSRYEKVASLSDNSDVDFYRIRAPQVPAGQALVLTATLTEMPVNGVVPIVSVSDVNGHAVNAEVLLNGNGTFTIQAANLSSGATYYLKVVGAPPPARKVGNYSLVVDFGGVAANLKTFASAKLLPSRPQDQFSFYVARSQLFQFLLSAGTPGVPRDARVRLEIYNGADQPVFTLLAKAGETVSGSSVFLTPGRYRLRFRAESISGGALPPVQYRLRGINLSDPIGPAQEDPTMETMYTCPDDPSMYCYPDGTSSDESYEVSSE